MKTRIVSPTFSQIVFWLPSLLPAVYGLLGSGFCFFADSLGAGEEFLRFGGAAGLVADFGQTIKCLCHKRTHRPERLLADRLGRE